MSLSQEHCTYKEEEVEDDEEEQSGIEDQRRDAEMSASRRCSLEYLLQCN